MAAKSPATLFSLFNNPDSFVGFALIVLTFVFALGHLVGPHADPSFAVVGQPGAALVPGRLAVPAVPEDVAFLLVGEDPVESRAMGRADRLLELRPVAAVYVVEVVAVFGEELAVARVEREPVTAGFQFGSVVVAFPVLVARYVVRVETEVVWAFERFLAVRACNRNDSGFNSIQWST